MADCSRGIDLISWLEKFGNQKLDPVSLCRLAYENRHSRFMRQITELSVAPPYKSSDDAPHNDFQLLRHYIGRLGHHVRASQKLVGCAPKLIGLLDEFDVRSIPTPPRAATPPTDGKTRLDSIIVRMLPAESPDVKFYQEAVAKMDEKINLTARMLETYRDQNFRPRVHAEIQVLEHFYENKLAFEDGDRYIACSKPACYCCSLYFRHHPGRFEEPASHGKIYLPWRPPDLQPENSETSQKEQRDILNAMIRHIREEVLEQIRQRQNARAWHPDSVTGITESVRLEQITATPGYSTRDLEITENLDSPLSPRTSSAYSAEGESTMRRDSSTGSISSQPTSHLPASDSDDAGVESDCEPEGGVRL